jgi:hypothetical protein
MQEAELKRREERRFKKEREEEEQTKGKKQEAVFSVEKPEVREIEKIAKKQIIFKMPFLQPKEFKELKMREGGFNKAITKIIFSKIPFLQPKEIKEVKTKIKAFSTEISEIKPIQREIPKINIKTKPFKGVSRKFFVFNLITPTIEKKNINLAVPNITTKYFHGLKSRNMNFNQGLPKISILELPVFVPRIGVKTFSRVKAKEKTLIPDIPQVLSKVTPSAEVIERGEEEVKKIAEIQEGTASEISGGDAEKEELFELFIKSSTGHFPKSLNAKEPLVIILSKSDDDNYASALQIICRELFHELIGGLPTSVIRSKGKKDIEEDLRAENRIEFIDDSKTKYFNSTFSKIKTSKEFENNVDWEEIGKRLNEFFTQGFGFVIFQIPEDFVQEFKRKLEEVTGDLKPQIMELSPQYIGHRLIDLAVPKEIDLIKLKRDFSSAIWGFVIPKGDSRWNEGEKFDNFFTACENEFYKRLNKIGRNEIKVGDKKLPPSFLVNIGENERDLHYWIKVFIVKYLIEKEKYGKDAIKTEDDAKIINSKKREVKPDIKVNSKVIEVETLYRTGLEYHEPLNKVTETIKRYKDENFNVWVVLKNLDLFFYHKDLKKLKKSAKEEWNVDVKFFGLDLDKEELVPLEEFVKIVKSQKAKEG